MAGYSKTPLAKKLGIKPGCRLMLINSPEYYFDLFTDMPEDVNVSYDATRKIDVVHFFTTNEKELNMLLPRLRAAIVQNGIIWASWPKKSAKIVCDVSENLIRETALKNGLVDVKVCAVDETWSGLKLVIPVKDRMKA